MPQVKNQQVVESQAELRELLVANGMDLSRWGVGGAKSVANLWDEIVGGDTMLQKNPLLRIVFVTVIVIRRGDKVLIETKQKLRDGRMRSRYRLPSEKMKPHEPYAEAALRCLAEELAVSSSEVEVIEASHEERWSIKESPSYPGLRTKYLFHTVDVVVPKLPSEDFYTSEVSHNRTDPVVGHYWSWVTEEGNDETR
jgi:hypothetical protein